MTTDQISNENEIAESREALRAIYQLPVDWTKSFLAIDEAASKGNHQEALALLQAATLPEDVSRILRRAIETVTCPPKTEPVRVLDWRLSRRGLVNGQERVQTGTDHWEAA